MPIRLSACPPAHLPACPPPRLPTCPPARLPACPPARLPARLPTCPPVRLSACPPVRLSACPPVRLSACPPAYQTACLVPIFLFSHHPTCPPARLPTLPPVHLPAHLPTCPAAHSPFYTQVPRAKITHTVSGICDYQHHTLQYNLRGLLWTTHFDSVLHWLLPTGQLTTMQTDTSHPYLMGALPSLLMYAPRATSPNTPSSVRHHRQSWPIAPYIHTCHSRLTIQHTGIPPWYRVSPFRYYLAMHVVSSCCLRVMFFLLTNDIYVSVSAYLSPLCLVYSPTSTALLPVFKSALYYVQSSI